MNHRHRLILLPLLVVAAVCARAQSPADEGAVRAVANSWSDAWNRHDMALLAKLFTEDADFVNVGGRHWKGREQIE